jgi:hypothetical protein
MKYTADMITVNKWAEHQQMPDGKWNQTWDIILKNPIAETSDIEKVSKKISHEDFDVQIKVSEGKRLTVSTKYPERDDPSLFSTFRLFENIDLLLGEIDTIQGQKMEDRFSPYRLSEKKKYS